MNDDEKVMLVECDQRSKSNTHQIEEIKADIKSIKEDQKLMYDLTTSVKVISENLIGMKDDLKEVKQGQVNLSDKIDNQIKEIKTDVDSKVGSVNQKVDAIEKQPYDDYKQTTHDIKIKVIVGVVSTLAISAIGFLVTLFANGHVKF
jgi:chromosome segregation ATPase